jgi:hypothetical protein
VVGLERELQRDVTDCIYDIVRRGQPKNGCDEGDVKVEEAEV